MTDNITILCDSPRYNGAYHIYDYVEVIEGTYINQCVHIPFVIMISGEIKMEIVFIFSAVRL